MYGLLREQGKAKSKSLFDTTLYVSSEVAPLGWEREVRWYRKADGNGEELIKSGLLDRDTLYVLAGEDIGTRVRAGVLYRFGNSKTQELYTDYTESVSLSQKAPLKPSLTVVGGGKVEFGEVLEVGVDALPLPAGWSWEIRWLRVDPGVGPVVIADATEKRYIIKYEDIGKHLLSEVRYVKGVARTLGTRTDATSLIGKGIDLPATKPVVLGDAKLGELLVGSNFDQAPGSGEWKLKYLWFRTIDFGGKPAMSKGKPIYVPIYNNPGVPSDAKSYRLVSRDVRNYVAVGQYFEKTNGAKTPFVMSDGVGPVELNISPPTKPVIDGELKVGYTLRASLGLVPTGWTRKVRWYRSRSKDAGYKYIPWSFRSVSYRVKATDMEGYLRAGVYYVNEKEHLSTDEVYSDGVGPVAISASDRPDLIGNFYVSSEITASVAAAPTGWTLDVKWYFVGQTKEIGTDTKYKIQKAYIFKQLQVKIRYRKDDGSQQTDWVYSERSPIIEAGKPLAPLNLYPEDGKKTGVTRDQMLSWSPTTDPDNSKMTYDVYLGHSSKSNMKKVATVDTNFYKPSSYLQRNSIYYWKVIAHDDDGYEVESATQTFHTTRLLRKYNSSGYISGLYFYPSNSSSKVVITSPRKVNVLEVDKFSTDVKSDFASTIQQFSNGDKIYSYASALGQLVGTPTNYTLLTSRMEELHMYSVYPDGSMKFLAKHTASPRMYGSKRTRYRGARHGISSVAIHPGGKYIAVGYSPEPFVEIYKYEGGALQKMRTLGLTWLALSMIQKSPTITGLRVHTLKFSPSGDHLTVLDGITARLWDFNKLIDGGFAEDIGSTRIMSYTAEYFNKKNSARYDYFHHPQYWGSYFTFLPGVVSGAGRRYNKNPYTDALFIPSSVSGTNREQLMTMGLFNHLFDASTGDFKKYIIPYLGEGNNTPYTAGAMESSGRWFVMGGSKVILYRFVPSTNRYRFSTRFATLWPQKNYHSPVRIDGTAVEVTFGDGYDRIIKLALSPDNKVLVAGDRRGRVFLWDTEGF